MKSKKDGKKAMKNSKPVSGMQSKRKNVKNEVVMTKKVEKMEQVEVKVRPSDAKKGASGKKSGV